MAFAHHHAAFDDERRGSKAEFVGAEHGGDGDIASRLELTIGLQSHAPAQIVHHQRLLRFGEPKLPWRARAHNR